MSINARVLVVAGGGGGGDGGGGAGGYLYDSAHTLTSGTYTVSVGNGGSGNSSGTVDPGNGQNSTFDTLTAHGGGGGVE